MTEPKRTGIWELNYTATEAPICQASGAAWLYGRGKRAVEKPLAIIYSDEIIIPEGVLVTMVPDEGAIRLRLRDRGEVEGAEAMAQAERDQKEWARIEADRLVEDQKLKKSA